MDEVRVFVTHGPITAMFNDRLVAAAVISERLSLNTLNYYLKDTEGNACRARNGVYHLLHNDYEVVIESSGVTTRPFVPTHIVQDRWQMRGLLPAGESTPRFHPFSPRSVTTRSEPNFIVNVKLGHIEEKPRGFKFVLLGRSVSIKILKKNVHVAGILKAIAEETATSEFPLNENQLELCDSKGNVISDSPTTRDFDFWKCGRSNSQLKNVYAHVFEEKSTTSVSTDQYLDNVQNQLQQNIRNLQISISCPVCLEYDLDIGHTVCTECDNISSCMACTQRLGEEGVGSNCTICRADDISTNSWEFKLPNGVKDHLRRITEHHI